MEAASTLTVQQTIQAILSPALMISASGLLMLGLNNRYSAAINRIRLLNDEKRRLIKHQEQTKDFDYIDTIRFESITRQISSLFTRCNLLRRSIFFHYIGISSYLLTSINIGLNFVSAAEIVQSLPLATFFIGLCCSMIGVVVALSEVSLAYKVLQLEVRAE